MRPLQPALWIALSIVSTLSQPCSGAICGRYVAENFCLSAFLVGTDDEEVRGEGATEGDAGSSDGCGKVIRMPCTPMIQSR